MDYGLFPSIQFNSIASGEVSTVRHSAPVAQNTRLARIQLPVTPFSGAGAVFTIGWAKLSAHVHLFAAGQADVQDDQDKDMVKGRNCFLTQFTNQLQCL